MAENKSDAPPPASQEEEPQAAESAPEARGAAPTPRKERRRGRHGFTLFLATLGLLATALAGAAVVFRNQDERLAAVADAIEQAAKNPTDFIQKERQELGAWLKEHLPRGEEEQKAAASPGGPAEGAPRETAPSGPGWAMPQEVPPKAPERTAEAEPAPAPQAPAKPVAPPTAAESQAPATSVPPPSAVGRAEIASVVKRLEALEADVRAANDAAAEARRAAEAKSAAERTESPAAPTPETKTLVAALEARLDELAQSMAKLQEKLEQPKVGTRAPPDVDGGAARPQQTKALTALEALALAQTVQRALERAKPFAAELAALRRLGADPKAVAELAPFAEKGAPAPRDLLSDFEPIGKKLRAFENKPSEGTPLSEQLMREAQRLVHLRPKGEAAKMTADDLTPKIEKALAHDDLAGALQAFAALPEATRAQAKAFGETLAARRAAEEAAASLVASAIGDLDASKN